MAPIAAVARSAWRHRVDDAERLPRSRAPKLDSQLRALRARRLAGGARARDRGTDSGSGSTICTSTPNVGAERARPPPPLFSSSRSRCQHSRCGARAPDGRSPLWPIRRFPRLADVGLVVVLTAAPALAQSAPTGTIRGTVVDTHDGTPLRRVSVRLQATGQTTVTDEEGHFQFADVVAGEQELYVSAVDFILVKRPVTVAPGGVTQVTIALAH